MISYPLDELAGALLYFKCENLQLSGSFKIRGATNAVFSLSGRSGGRARRCYALLGKSRSSAGASRRKCAALRLQVVMPRSAPPNQGVAPSRLMALTFRFGEPTLAAREAAAVQLLHSTGGTTRSSL